MSITSIKNKVSARLAAGAVGAAMIVSLGMGVTTQAYAAGLTSTQIQSILSLLQSFGADQATISNVQAALNGQATTGTTGGSTSTTGSVSCTVSFSRSLSVGSTGADVKELQQLLNASGNWVATSGAGSPGNETTHFGPATKAAVMKFQAAHGLSQVGIVGPMTRAALNAMCGGTSSTGSTGGTVAPTGPGVTVSVPAQPAATLAPGNAARVPFTSFTLTNNTASAVTVNSVTVQRTGLANDSDFSGVVLVDSNGMQVGLSHTLNSLHQANLGDNFVLNPGQSMTYTVAGNMEPNGSNSAGAVAGFSVVAVNTSVPVSGSLPINGTMQTENGTVTIGTVSTSTSSFDPGAAQTKSIGATAVRFTGIRFTAGSAEDLKLMNIRWRQVGTAGPTDFSNVLTVVNGTSYPTTIDSTGKYYTTTFPNGILIPKGNSVDVYVQGDITGSNSANRTIQFNLDKVTDVYFVGQQYGFGVSPSGTNTPWDTGYITTIQGGSATSIQNATSVSSANIPTNVGNTVLGGFQTNFLGEPVSVSAITVRFTATNSGATDLLTNVSLVDQNGNVVAGPVNATGSIGTQTVKFGSTVTLPVGVMTYTLKGQVPADYANNTTIQASTTPTSDWTSPTGQTTGNTITLPSATVTMSTQTIKAASLAITASPSPVAQTIVSGGTGVTLGTVQLDASQSGENIRLNSLPLELVTNPTTQATNLTACQLFNGSTALNNGSNVVNPTSSTAETSIGSGHANTFVLDNSLVIPKGTVVTLTVQCNIVSGATGSYAWGVATGDTFTSTGVTSGNSVSATVTQATSGTQTLASAGSLTATAASSAVAQPALSLAAAGTTGVTQGQVKLHASNENISVTKLGLTLNGGIYGGNSNGSGNSSNNGVSDVTTAYVYNGSTLLGTATFTGNNQTATSTFTTPVQVPANTDVYLTIKTDLASIGVSAAGGIGDTVKVNPLNAQATGLSSGQTINIAATSGLNGVQMFRTVPTVALGTGACVGNGCNGSNQVLKVFTVTANASGPVSVQQFKLAVATSSANVTALTASVYDQNGNVASSTFGSQQCASGCSSNNPTLTFVGGPVIIPAGTTYTFKVTGTVTPGGSATNWSVTSILNGDSAAVANIGSSPTYIGTTTSIADSSDFVWSDNATTTVGANDVDWFNGYQVSGLPSIGI